LLKSELRKLIGTISASLGFFGLFLAAGTPSALAAEVVIPVEVVDVCSWNLAGTPKKITLTAPDGVKYEGAELDMSYTFEGLVLGLAGQRDPLTAIDGTSTNCSRYSNEVNAQVDFQLAESATFVAKYGAGLNDPDMTFNLSSTRPLRLEAEPTLGCNNDPTFDVGISKSFYNLADTPWSLVSSFASPNSFFQGQGPRCPIGLSLSVTLPPSEGTPLGAGYDYTFTGPALTIQLSGTSN
jgi:hypothetical protein